MSETGLQFPCICISQGIVIVVSEEEAVTTCTTAAIKNGWHREMLLVDTEGNARVVCGAEVLHGIGRFGGFNLFLNRRVRVRLQFRGGAFHLPLAELKRRVLDSFREWEGWSTRGDFVQLQERANAAQSVSDVIKLLSPAYSGGMR